MAEIDKQIDALYALPADEFTAARTTLARSQTGAAAAAVKALKKPTAVPWAVNQLYWRDRRLYQKLLDSGRALRTAQVAAIEGRKADLRQASDTHRANVSAAAARAVQLAQEAGVSSKPEVVARMLEAISLARDQPDHPGRFTEVLQPAAFEALQGIVPRAGADGAARPAGGRGSSGHANHVKEEKQREHEARAERKRLEGELEKAQQAFGRAHDAAVAARQRHAHAESELRAAEAALESAQAALKEFDSARR